MNTRIHILALDGIVNVNSLFTIGVFLGIAWNLSDPNNTLIELDSAQCFATSTMAEDMVKFHVYSFSSFMFSSLIAVAMKQGIRSTRRRRDVVHVNLPVLQCGILGSALGSVSGCVFLTLAIADFVQIKLGTLGCGSWHSAAAVCALVVLVPCALVIYIYVVLHAFTR